MKFSTLAPLAAAALLALGMFAPAAYADGSVQPGGTCTTDSDCADFTSGGQTVDYVCDGVCTEAAGAVGDTCRDVDGCQDGLSCSIPSGQQIGECEGSVAGLAPNGQNCSVGTTCQSGYCNPSTLECDVNPSGATTGQACSATVPCPAGQSCSAAGTCALPSVGGATTPTTGTTLLNPLGTGVTLNSLLTSILGFVVQIGSVVVILMLVYVGFKFVTAQGEPGKLSEAKSMLMWTIIGALVLLGAQAIATGIQATVSALSTGT